MFFSLCCLCGYLGREEQGRKTEQVRLNLPSTCQYSSLEKWNHAIPPETTYSFCALGLTSGEGGGGALKFPSIKISTRKKKHISLDDLSIPLIKQGILGFP